MKQKRRLLAYIFADFNYDRLWKVFNWLPNFPNQNELLKVLTKQQKVYDVGQVHNK